MPVRIRVEDLKEAHTSAEACGGRWCDGPEMLGECVVFVGVFAEGGRRGNFFDESAGRRDGVRVFHDSVFTWGDDYVGWAMFERFCARPYGAGGRERW